MSRTNRDVCFVDLETTGLDPELHEIIEIGAVRVDPTLGTEIGRYHVLVLPEHIETASPKALRVNGYDPERWAEEGIALDLAIEGLSRWIAGATIAGHNAATFDVPFLRVAFRKAEVDWPECDYHVLDTCALALPLKVGGLTPSVGLDAVLRVLRLSPRPSPHRALDDADASLRVARSLTEIAMRGRRELRRDAFRDVVLGVLVLHATTILMLVLHLALAGEL